MRKGLIVFVVAAVFLGLTQSAFAASDNLFDGMKAKLWRGLVNTFTGWVEIPVQIGKGYNEGFILDRDNKAFGAVQGLVEGLGHAAGRTGSGLVDLLAFWAANPESNEGVGIPLDAELAWEEGVSYDVIDPNFGEAGIKPMEKKLMRGVSNAFLGILEVPGQMKKVNLVAGFFKGVWAFFSREIYGFKDIATFFLPTPADEVGIAFDEENPWDGFSVE